MKRILALTIALIFIFVSAGEAFATSADFSAGSVEITSTKRQSTSLTAKWNPLASTDAYELQCCNNRFFTDPATAEIPADTTEYTFNGLSDKEQYYFRIRAYQNDISGGKKYTKWSHSENAMSEGQARVSQLKFNGKVFEIRSGANQAVGYYDTLQGGCIYKGFGYFTLYNRNKEKCKIAKFNLSTGKKIKVSNVLPISHGNDLAYNSAQGVIAAVHSTGNGKQVTIINPETLKVIRHIFINLDAPVPGMSEKQRTNFKGIGALAYNEEHSQYVARVKNTNDLLFMDKNLKPLRYVYLSKKDKQLFQGMDTCGDYVLVGQSPKDGKPYNIISVYDWDGNYISKINIKKGYELECLFNWNGKFYAGFYRSYYETYYKTAYKTVKVKNKNGKYVKKTVKYQQKKKRLKRDNYIYSMDKL